jgi:large subunit ribosomal protein L21
MYAVIETGGKQYRVEVGTELEVEKLEVEAGGTVTIDRVLLVVDGESTSIGRPIVADAAVSAEVVRQDRGDKVIVFKYRPKARRRVKKGHRQDFTLLRVTDVRLGTRSAAELARKADREAKTERQRLEEAASRQAAEDAALASKLAARSKEAGPDVAEAADTADTTSKSGRKTASKATAAKSTATPAAETKSAPQRSRTKAADTTKKAEPSEAPKRSRTKKDE